MGATRLSVPIRTIQKLHITKIIMRNFITISLRKTIARGVTPQQVMLYYVK